MDMEGSKSLVEKSHESDVAPSGDSTHSQSCSHSIEPRDSPIPPTSNSSPPVTEIQFEQDSVSERQGIRSCVSRRVLMYGVSLWITALVGVISLDKAGVTDTELLFEEFMSKSIFSNFEGSWAMINGSISSGYASYERSRPGFQMSQKGAKVKYPIVMVPGFVTSGLELWGGKECARKHFRERMWGGLSTARQFFTDRECWLEHLALDPMTGGDPEGIRLRTAQGFEAADYFMANYWVWGKLIENLADVGYDGSTMLMASYDWRLAFPILEKRDGYLTRLRHSIEAMHETTGEKVVIASHSMGSQLVTHFFAWVEASKAEGGGGEGKLWVDKHVHAFVNIAGPMLGVPKAAPALLSGEMRDTTNLLGTIGLMVEQFFGRRLRKDLWITWGSLWAMLPKGGDAIWGIGSDIISPISNESRAEPDSQIMPLFELTNSLEVDGEQRKQNRTHCKGVGDDSSESNLEISLSDTVETFLNRRTHSVEQTIKFLQSWGGGHGPSLSNAKLHSYDKQDEASIKTWHDASRTPLPHAPSLKIYCLYGVGLETERAYLYKRNGGENTQEGSEDLANCDASYFDPPIIMNTSVDDEFQRIVRGVKFSDGDGSVPLLSLGYLCVDAWTRKDSGLNPSGAEVVTLEYNHRQEFMVDDPMRNGPYSADHVDILGNLDMTTDFLRIVTGFEESDLKTHIVSDIVNITTRINSHPMGGLYLQGKRRASGHFPSLKGKSPSLWDSTTKLFASIIQNRDK